MRYSPEEAQILINELAKDGYVTVQDKKVQEAMVFLSNQLKGGARSAAELYRTAQKVGISETVLKEARRELNVEVIQAWTWRLRDRIYE